MKNSIRCTAVLRSYERCLIDDYRAMEASLRGTWLSTLNFEYIEIQAGAEMQIDVIPVRFAAAAQ